ncbi:MAG: class I SAM-dependent methyltransferase [Sphingobacteriales bacterium]|nr:MAG: class I SAM-dependent methyltransferase [Sphingobacteriales bacterium]
MIHYDDCPVCGQKNIADKFVVKDYTVSGEEYMLQQCRDCSFVFTQDIPSQDEIGPYYASQNYISHSNTQKGFINNIYHRVRKITLASKRKLIEDKTGISKGNHLDVGCGTGAFLNEMKNAGWKITGLELDETARKNAQELFNINPQPSHELFSLPAESYDAITMWHVLEHVHQLHEYVAQLKKLLKPGGKLFIAVPNYTSSDAAHYQRFWAAYDVPRHLYHFSPASMRVLMEKHALQVLQTKPMWFDSFYVSMLSEQYKNGKGNIIGAFFTGLLSNAKALFNKERCSSVIYVIGKK